MSSQLNYLVVRAHPADRIRAAQRARMARTADRRRPARRGWASLASLWRVRAGARVPSVEEC